jgi:7,8-dihydropterin-6-yl-methyl-4-(beta-D-ribofuranosyl)aminobenzene 5'-phosphate synthase
MMTRRRLLAGSVAATATAVLPWDASAAEGANQATVLFDAFGKPSDLKRGWGYSLFIEHGGRRILFDTGGSDADFAANASALGVDLKKLDFVVLSHRHNDHTAGLNQVLRENPDVTIYSPFEGAGFDSPIAGPLMNLIKRNVASVPDDLRYFDGNPPAIIRSGAPWLGAHFAQIGEPKEVLPGVFLFSTRSDKPGTREMNEISMLMKTSQGGVLVVGCSHPGIELILEAVTKIEPRIHSVFGGFHLVDLSDDETTAMVTRLRDKWQIERMAAGHCTGQFAFVEMGRVFGAKFEERSFACRRKPAGLSFPARVERVAGQITH